MGTYRQQLPSEPDASWLVRQAVDLGQQVGISFTSITQDSPQPGKVYTRLGVTLRFEATYHDVGRLIDLLEGADGFMNVERLNMSPPLRGVGPQTVDLVLSSIYLAPPTGLGAR